MLGGKSQVAYGRKICFKFLHWVALRHTAHTLRLLDIYVRLGIGRIGVPGHYYA